MSVCSPVNKSVWVPADGIFNIADAPKTRTILVLKLRLSLCMGGCVGVGGGGGGGVCVCVCVREFCVVICVNRLANSCIHVSVCSVGDEWGSGRIQIYTD